MRVLVDTNILLDVLLLRAPWVDESRLVWQAQDDGQIRAFIAAVSPPNVFYIVRELTDARRAREGVRICLEAFNVLPLNGDLLRAAFDLNDRDFEDDVHIACAAASRVDAIVTRDAGGFTASSVPVLSPAELLAKLTGKP
jgi:predicted nucleic acid-binding protein